MSKSLLVILVVFSALLAACSLAGNDVAQAPSGLAGSDPEIGAGREEVGSPSIDDSLEGEVGGGGPVNASGGDATQSTLAPVDWLTYTDPQNAFTLQYPAAYVVAPPAGRKSHPSLDREVYFQEKSTGTSGAAEFDPPAFGVRVFPNPASLSAIDWLVNAGFIASDGIAEWSTIVTDGVSGVSNCALQDTAPTCYRYFLFKDQIYELSPNGESSLGMLESFHFLK